MLHLPRRKLFKALGEFTPDVLENLLQLLDLVVLQRESHNLDRDALKLVEFLELDHIIIHH